MAEYQITEIKLQTIIDNQETVLYYSFLDSLVPIKEELILLGKALNRKDVKKLNSEVFGTRNVHRMWKVLLENDFNVEETELYPEYDSGELKIHILDFINAVKKYS